LEIDKLRHQAPLLLGANIRNFIGSNNPIPVNFNGFHTIKFFLVTMLPLTFINSCESHNHTPIPMNTSDTLLNRQPAVAGSFYPADPVEIRHELKSYFAKAPARDSENEVLGIITPHAGYVFSGEVAAAAFSQVDPNKNYKTIFVLGCSHRSSFQGASVYSIGNYITPLGVVETDLEVARKLVSENKVLAFDPQYHREEHSIEVQIPFLQYYLKTHFKIVAIMLGTQDDETCREIAQALKPYFVPENLFVISTDFSHYPAYADAVKNDKMLADAIVTNNPHKFLKAVESCTHTNVANLVTGCCSWPAVITLMYLTEKQPGLAYKEIIYKNSGDSDFGEKGRVVGYNALSLVKEKERTMTLNSAEKQELLLLARNTIDAYLKTKHIPDIEEKSLPARLKNNAGAFVTLKKHGELRGCIGHFEADQPLYEIVQEMAVASSTQDYRFSSVKPDEMKSIDIEISVLTPMQKITDVQKIQLGVDGIYIKKGGRAGTFLPQVATDTGWNLEEFLGHCARDKAGISWDGWKDKDAEIYVYQAFVFSEKE
jgi:MEMO1 family protein